jgi:hypothetical protein
VKVVLYSAANTGRAGHIAKAMQIGIRRHGMNAEIETRWTGQVLGDVAIAYGWKHEAVFRGYRAVGGHFAYFDMGYFNRKPSNDKGGSREGHHRLAVDGWDTADTMARGCPSDRWEALGIEVKPNRVDGAPGAILVAGMSDKAAGTHGFKPGQWEAETLAMLRDHGNGGRQVIFRAKPTSLATVEPIESVLERTSLIVTNHSNVAVDGLVAGVPCYARKGVGKLVSLDTLVAVGQGVVWKPAPPIETRRQLLADVAYAQWSPAEMRDGSAWEHIKGLINA